MHALLRDTCRDDRSQANLYSRRTGRPSVLADFTPPHGEGPQLAPPIGSCRHEFVTKPTQSFLPPLDLRPDGTTIYKLAAVCKKCRIHTAVVVNHSDASNPCPTSEHPLHHFQRAQGGDLISTDHIQYAWACSVPECRAALTIAYRKSRFDEEDMQLLTSPEALEARYNVLIQEDPEREGMKVATQMDALSRLRRYIKDSLAPGHSKRQIPANNKRFQEAYGRNGEDCAEILDRLGFKYAVSFVRDEQDGSGIRLMQMQDNNWILPNPDPLDDRIMANGNSMRELLEDAELELLLWMHKLASEFRLVNPHASEILPSADKDIERTLAAQGCMFAQTSSYMTGDETNEHMQTRATLHYVAQRQTKLFRERTSLQSTFLLTLIKTSDSSAA